MKSQLSLKIFLVMICTYIAILGISFKINFETQVNLYNDGLRMRHVDKEYFKDLYHDLELNDTYNDPEVVESKIKSDNFQFPASINFPFMIKYYDNQIHIIEDNFEDNYIVIYGNSKRYSVNELSDEQKTNLIDYVMKCQQDTSISLPGKAEVEYEIVDEKITYLKWDDQVYGQIQKSSSKGSIWDFCILGKMNIQGLLTYEMFLAHYNELQEVVKNIRGFSGNVGAEAGLQMWDEYKGKYYYIYLNNLTGTENVSDDIYTVTVAIEDVKTVHNVIRKQYLEDNAKLYVGSFILVAGISWLIAYAIGKPIKKIEKVAQKITNQDFSEPIVVKSNDEIGSLAKSIDIMRVQLKQTIEQLNQEIEHVKELESLRKDFVNQFTHEMKTPLGIINGYSELLDEAESDEEKEKYLEIINHETDRINQLIQAMLNLSRLEAGKVELHKEEIDLEDIVTDIIEEYEVLLMKKHIHVDIKVIHNIIYADAKHIQTVVRNFLSNAIKHTFENGKIVITINNGISVLNEGKPIEEDRLDSIWYTFVTHDKNGSGLGLAICRSILELHGFDYGVNNLDNGVEFYFHQ